MVWNGARGIFVIETQGIFQIAFIITVLKFLDPFRVQLIAVFMRAVKSGKQWILHGPAAIAYRTELANRVARRNSMALPNFEWIDGEKAKLCLVSTCFVIYLHKNMKAIS